MSDKLNEYRVIKIVKIIGLLKSVGGEDHPSLGQMADEGLDNCVYMTQRN